MGSSLFNPHGSGTWQTLRQALAWVSLPFMPSHAASSPTYPSWALQSSAQAPAKPRPQASKRTRAAPVTPMQCGAASRSAPSRLKVLREFEPDVAPSCAGRMVISGRMADVCAELDRMATLQTPSC